jgi:GNAT superfamily N-acetyltransferase
MPIAEAIRRFAEEPDFEQPEPWPPGKILKRPRFTLNLSPEPHHSVVSRVRTTVEELDATFAEARAILREHEFLACAWSIGPSCRPLGLAQLLLDRGFVPAKPPTFEPHFTAMALTAPPVAHAPRPGVEARAVRSLDEYLLAFRTALTALGESEEAIAKWIEGARGGWDHQNGIAKLSQVAFVDGEIAGVGFTSYGPSAVLLGGAAVLPAYRGRGAYRALVASRWQAAVAMGKPALVVQAGAMSRPILERCGFEAVCGLDLFLDPTLG